MSRSTFSRRMRVRNAASVTSATTGSGARSMARNGSRAARLEEPGAGVVLVPQLDVGLALPFGRIFFFTAIRYIRRSAAASRFAVATLLLAARRASYSCSISSAVMLSARRPAKTLSGCTRRCSMLDRLFLPIVELAKF